MNLDKLKCKKSTNYFYEFELKKMNLDKLKYEFG
jgi:hypothetical protein